MTGYKGEKYIENKDYEMRAKICTLCNGNLDGTLYYCMHEDCAGTFPLCVNCLCQECGSCTLCCLCHLDEPEQEWGNLFCRSCGQVEMHRLSGRDIWCAVCTTEYDDEQISIIEKWLEGVDGDFMAKVAQARGEDEGYETAMDRDVVYCRDCASNTPHIEQETTTSVNASPMVQLKCKTCGAVRFGRWRLYDDGSVEDVDGKRVYSKRELDKGDARDTDDPHDKPPVNDSQASYGNQWQGGMGYGYHICKHWKEPVKIGRHTVLCSASGDRSEAKDTDPKPDYGVYLSTMGWGMRIMVSPDFPSEELHLVLPYPRLTLDWVDMMAAPRGAATEHVIKWTAEKIAEGKLVDIGCFGGHGRTGTLLAVLMVEIEKLTPAEAIDAVHERYCKECIESLAQARFVYEWAGEKMPAGAWTKTTYSYKAKPPIKSTYKYASRKEKKESKKARRKRRADFANQVKQAAKAGKTRIGFESEGIYWRCTDCYTIKRDNTRGGKEPNVKWWTYCSTCQITRQHERPMELFRELGGN